MRAQTGKAILLLFVATVSTITILNGGVGRTFHSGSRELLTLVHPVEPASPGTHHPASTVVKSDVGGTDPRTLREQGVHQPTANDSSIAAVDAISTGSPRKIGLASTASNGRRGAKQAAQANGKGGGNGKNSAGGKGGGWLNSPKSGTVSTGGLPPKPKNSKDLTYGIPIGDTLKKVDKKINSSLLGKLIKRGTKPLPLGTRNRVVGSAVAGTSPSTAAKSSPKGIFRRKLEKHREKWRKMAEGIATAGEEEVGLQGTVSPPSSSSQTNESKTSSRRSRRNRSQGSGKISAASSTAASQTSGASDSTSSSKKSKKNKKSKVSQMVFGIPLGTGKDAIAYHADRTIIGKQIMNRRKKKGSGNSAASSSGNSSSGNSTSGTQQQVGTPVSPIKFKRASANSKVWQTTGKKPVTKPGGGNRRRLLEASEGGEGSGREGGSVDGNVQGIGGAHDAISGVMEGRVHRVLGDVSAAGEGMTEESSSSGVPGVADSGISGAGEVRVERHLGERHRQKKAARKARKQQKRADKKERKRERKQDRLDRRFGPAPGTSAASNAALVAEAPVGN